MIFLGGIAAKAEAGSVVASTSRSYRFMIVDDDAEFRSVLAELFRPFVDLVEAECGEQAVELLKDVEVHLCLLDMNMRMMTGLETARFVKSHNHETPCIIITANVTEGLKREAGDADVYSVLAKPVRRRELLHTVSSALEDAYRDSEIQSRLSSS